MNSSAVYFSCILLFILYSYIILLNIHEKFELPPIPTILAKNSFSNLEIFLSSLSDIYWNQKCRLHCFEVYRQMFFYGYLVTQGKPAFFLVRRVSVKPKASCICPSRHAFSAKILHSETSFS